MNIEVMKVNIYVVTYTSYEASDNYLYNEVKTLTNETDAVKFYEEWCNCARIDAKGYDDEYSINQVETPSEKGRKFQVSRESCMEYGYDAIIQLSMTEVEI